jgi:putative ABC transport system ATP-binding protein
MSAATPLLEAQDIGRRNPNGEGWLLDDVRLGISAGTRLSVTGPSGAGKTLLLRALAMLDPLDRGHVLWKGRTVRRDAIPAFRGSVIYLHQRAALLEETVVAALRRPFDLRVHRQRRFHQAEALELLARLGRDAAFLDKRASDLSGGEIQITALVRALLLQPTVLLLDEPTASLDADAARAVEELLCGWVAAAPERAMVWVSHNAQQAGRIADRTAAMEGGKLSEWPPGTARGET